MVLKRKGGAIMNVREHKNKVLVGVVFLIVVLAGAFTVYTLNNQKDVMYQQGAQAGMLAYQNGILQALQTTGYVTLNFGVNQQGQPVNLVLAPVQVPQQQGTSQQQAAPQQ